MGLLGMGAKGTTLLLMATGYAIFSNYPPPSMSPQMLAWLAKGSFFNYQGHSIFYREERARDSSNGSTLILLHGFPTQGFDWSKIWNGVIKRFDRVIAMDFIGFGFSDKPAHHKYTIMEQASIYEALLNELGVTEVHVLAHDHGDSVAQEMLARFNEQYEDGKYIHIHSMCLLNGGIFKETNTPRPSQKIMMVPYIGNILTKLSNRYIFKRGLHEVFGIHTKPSDVELTDFYAGIRMNDGDQIMPNILDYLRQRATNNERWTKALQDTSVPLHVIWGPSDLTNSPAFIEFYKKTVPGGGLTVLKPEIGHYPQWETPESVLDAYLNFIDAVTY